MGDAPFLLEARGVTKRFGDTIANDAIDLAVRPGSIHALLGENGAGKSTLVKILYGALQPDEGTILWHGERRTLASPAEARTLGIGMVFQHFSLFDALTVAENVALGMDDAPRNPRKLDAAIREVSETYRLPIDPRRMVGTLSAGEKQRIEIVRCLLQNPSLLIMDEPTSVLTAQEAANLFETLRELSATGCSVLYISHRLQEVRDLCDDGTVLRGGRTVARVDVGAETANSLAIAMIGRGVEALERSPERQPGEPRLMVRGLNVPPLSPFSPPLSDIDLKVRAGEVLAIAGLAGSGQSELFAALSGELAAPRNAILIDDEPLGDRGIAYRRATGAAFVPEERLGHAAVPDMSLSENVVLSQHDRPDIARYGFIRAGGARKRSEAIGAEYDVRRGHGDPKAASLSGGNLQKFVMGRELGTAPGILVVDQPTWGVDAGAARTIRQAIIDRARDGAAVLVISQDLDEVFEIADRVAVLHHGRLSEAYPTASMTSERLGLLMGGLNVEPEMAEVLPS